MRVIGAGLPRTGTSSLKAALERLGFGPCYHMFETVRNPEHVDRWRPVLAGQRVRWDEVFAGYRSAVDFPASVYWRQQAEAYPEAKVVLSVRDPRGWYASIQRVFTFARVRDALPPDRLLVFDVREGWGPLCEFLGVEVPDGEPFPRLNDAETMARMREEMVRSGTLVTPFDDRG